MDNITIVRLTESKETDYSKFLLDNPGALFFHSLKYKRFLTKILQQVEDIYLLAYLDEVLVGILPAFIKRPSSGKPVINSLPFYGSHGGVLVDAGKESELVKKTLMDELMRIASDNHVAVLTVIDNPAAAQSELYKDYLCTEPSDERIGQITNIAVEEGNVEEQLMNKFHSKTRNMVRKGLKSGFTVTTDESKEAITKLYTIHSENLKAIGGTEKPLSVFEAIHEIFEAGTDYQIFFAEKNGDIAAGLLVFYFKEYCEYFTPVINQEYRSDQPLSLLILKAMEEATSRGAKFWNWGGTWISQEGVYKFKKRWGSEDHPYYYYTKVIDQSILKQSSEEILREYLHFFVVPFSQLKSQS